MAGEELRLKRLVALGSRGIESCIFGIQWNVGCKTQVGILVRRVLRKNVRRMSRELAVYFHFVRFVGV